MSPQFRSIVQNYLTSYIQPRTRTDGGFAGDTPPPSPEVFQTRLEEEEKAFGKNAWDLDHIENLSLINLAVATYSVSTWAWLTKPLAGDAPAEVQTWYQENQR